MMEKYGVSREDLPPTSEQMEKLAKLKAKEIPQNAQEADELIFKYLDKGEK